MEGFVNGIKKISRKHENLKGFVSLPMSGNTREITEELIKAFKRLGVKVIQFDIEEKFHQYMQIVNPVFYDSNKQEFSQFVESFIEKDFLFDIVSEKPDFIFSFTNGFLDAKALDVAKVLGIKVALFHPKEYYVEDDIESLLKSCEYLFVPPGFKGTAIDFNPEYELKVLSPACDIHKFSPREVKKDLFVTVFGDVSLYRVNIVNNLVKKGVNVSIIGLGWKEYVYLPEVLKSRIIEDSEYISSDAWMDVFRRSKIVLSLPFDVRRDGTVECKLNYLTFAAAGCGASLVGYSKDSSLSPFTHLESIMLYETEEDLLNTITTLDKDDDLLKFIGLSAIESIRIKHTTTKRAEEILELIVSSKK